MRLWAGNRNFCKREFHRRLNSLLILEGGKADKEGLGAPYQARMEAHAKDLLGPILDPKGGWEDLTSGSLGFIN